MDDSKDSPSTEKDVVLFFTYVAGRMKDQKVSIPPKTSRKRKQTAPTPSSRATRQRTQKPSTMGSNDTGESSQPMDVSDEDYNMHDFIEAKELKDSKDCEIEKQDLKIDHGDAIAQNHHLKGSHFY
ncbi:hypothetical protein Tco_1065407 [Tanacetum coccineum]